MRALPRWLPRTRSAGHHGDRWGDRLGRLLVDERERLGQTLGTTRIDSSGSFVLPFTVPATAPVGVTQLQFSPTCSHSTYMPFVPFTMTQGTPGGIGACCSVGPDGYSCRPEQHQAELAGQFRQRNRVRDHNGVVSRNAAANSTTYTWGGLAPRTYMCFKIRAYNSAGNSAWEPSTSPGYRCTTTPAAKPVIHWSRTSGPPRTHFTLTGSGWVPLGTVRVQFPSKGIFYGRTSWPVDSQGRWRQDFATGDTPPGTYRLKFSEISGHLLVSGNFKVLVAHPGEVHLG